MSLRVVGAKEAAWWAEELYRDRVPADWEVPEPDCWEAARAAVERFRELDADSGVNRRAAVGSRRAAKGVSTDWLQGVSEVVQNAEDLGATEVRLQVADGVLRLAHNGRPVRLRDVIPLSMPWLSGKSDDAESVGRFGIGLMSLFRFAPQFDLYSGIYRLRIGEEGLDHASDRPALSVFGPGEWTVFHVPLTREVVAAGARRTLTAEALEEWLTAWGHEALLFLRHVAAVVLVDGEGRLLRRLTLRRTAVEGFGAEVASERAAVEATDVRAPGGRGWRVFHAVVASPPGLEPEGKPVGEVTPLAVACPWTPGSARPADRETHQVGYVHARLPVAPFPLPVRLHAAFDPVPSRQDLQDTSWNLALGQRLADLWAAVVLEQFRADPAACWSLLPLPRHTTEVDQRGAVSALAEALMERSRHQVGVRLRIGVPDRGMYPLEDLAVEDPELTRLLTEAEIERLADHPVLPAAARDTDGVYREVLKDWTDHGYLAPVRVSLRDAQQLLGDTERSVEATVSLAAACLDTVWGIFMDDFPWIADTAGARHRPLRSQELRLFADRPGSLAEKLGFARVLHPEFLTDSPAAARVRAWLTEHNALLVDDDELTALRRLAGYGQNLTARPTAPALRLTDEQVCLLKAAFARLEDADRRRLGEDLGRAVALPAYEYLPDGRRQESWAAIASVYLPAGVDRTERTEGFPFAAARTPGLFWLRPRCVTVLRESGPGLGPLEFLRELGAASTPRTMLHRRRELRLHQLGLPAGAPGSRARTLQMLSLGAQYTLGDREAPDLDAVACDIAAEPDGAVRRKRAAALLHVLGRAWEARYARDTQIIAAEAHRKWYTMGKVPAFWLWRLRDEIAWLDSEHGTPVRPAQLRRRTEATALVYGADAGKVLHPEIQKAVERREPVLKALKVGGEPTTADIVERLRQLRSAELDGEPADVPAAMLLYRVLAGRTIPPRAPDGDLSRADLIKAFAEGPGLVRTETGWHTPASCLRGKPIFDSFREFAPPVANGDALWEMLGVPAPSADDAIAVIRELSRVAPDTSGSQLDAEGQSVVLQSLQLLQTYAAGDPDALKGRPLRRLPLWTDRGWARRRPVYALADETMAGQLGTVLSASGHAGAVWRPGTDLEHVGDIAARLGVTILGPDSMMPRVDTPPRPDTDATTRFAAAVAHLREDLQRRDPVTTRELAGPWQDLTELIVCVVPRLAVTVPLPDDTIAEVPARAAIDTTQGVLFVTDRSELGRFASVGQAIAGRFRSRRPQVAYAWPVAWERAEAGHAAVDITRAEDRIAALNAIVDAELHQRLTGFHEANVARHTASAERTAGQKPSGSSRQADRSASTTSQAPAARSKRRLINPTQWRPILTPTAEPGSPRSASSGPEGASRPVLAFPRETTAVPRPRQGARGFTAEDQELAALDLVRAALARDCEELRDLHAQRRLGADAMDEQDRFYEIKSTLSAEQDSVSLTLHEYERALTEKDFFLVIVSGLDRNVSAPPTVRIILDPLRHLTVRAAPDVLLTGIRSCPSIPISFERNE